MVFSGSRYAEYGRDFEAPGSRHRQRHSPGDLADRSSQRTGEGVVRRKLAAKRAQEILEELALLPIRPSAPPLEVPKQLELAAVHNISVYDACYLQAARLDGLPLATNDHDLQEAAESYGLMVMTP
jgi:predicted nucleic acid-binding protein